MLDQVKQGVGVLWGHARGVMGLNVKHRERNRLVETCFKGIEGFEQVTSISVKKQLHSAGVWTERKARIGTVSPYGAAHDYLSASSEAGTFLAIFSAPIAVVNLTKGAISSAKIAADKTRSKTVRVYHLAKASLNASRVGFISGFMGKQAVRGCDYLGQRSVNSLGNSGQALVRGAGKVACVFRKVLPVLQTVSTVLGVARPFVHGFAAYQGHQLEKALSSGTEFDLDKSIAKEIFGVDDKGEVLNQNELHEKYQTNSDQIQKHIKAYKRLQMVRSAFTAAEFVISTIFSSSGVLAPVGWIVMVPLTLATEMFMDLYWDRKVKHFRTEMGLPLEQPNHLTTVARVVSFLSLPLLAFKNTAPFGVAGLAVGVGLEVFAYVIKRRRENAEPEKESRTPSAPKPPFPGAVRVMPCAA